MALTHDQKVAFAEFLLSERKRHEEDIEMIDKKLRLLYQAGIEPKGEAPWVTDEDLKHDPFKFIQDCTFRFNNESPLGGYWRYQVDNAFENTTFDFSGKEYSPKSAIEDVSDFVGEQYGLP